MEEKFTFFWSGPFSQWSFSPFEINGEKYNCAEQYMMAEKARFFKDWSTEAKIMASHDPSEQKSFGRMIAPFDAVAWDMVCCRVVYTGSFFKYLQSKKHRIALYETEGTTLVEASPLDKIWGIGLIESDPRALTRETWQGKNYLGEILTRVRNDLMALGVE
jgi:ribA/ribD-fused uncharacterized protein